PVSWLFAVAEIARPPYPRNEIAPVIEVEVCDHDRVGRRPPVTLAQPREHSGTAVEEGRASAVEEIAGLCAAGVRPGRRAADDRESHYLSATMRAIAWSSFQAIEPFASTIGRNAHETRPQQMTSLSAVTVAVRGDSASKAISPK